MFREVPHAQQDATFDGRRRWFTDAEMDLIVWQSRDGAIEGFQLCYDTTRDERSLTWHRQRGFSHHGVDTGEDDPSVNRSPMMVADGACPWDRIESEFKRSAADLDRDVIDFVMERLRARR